MEISDTEEVEGINDYLLVWEFEESWVDAKNYQQVLADVEERVRKMQLSSSHPPTQESTKLIRGCGCSPMRNLPTSSPTDASTFACSASLRQRSWY
mmetsp:Transcript_32818/g.45853  ORF Transcript_32818/g.45853 Transcript_32818/m.45853 type:complete len:96 (+) Transcript_32818:160-447(+)